MDFGETIGYLMIAREKVKAIPPSSLDADQKAARTRQMRVLRQGIEALVAAHYEQLSAEASESAGSLKAAADNTQASLKHLKAVSDAIDVVSSLVGVVAKFLLLVK